MALPKMTRDDLGGFYTRPDGSLWLFCAFTDLPNATLERVYAGPVRTTSLLEEFRRIERAAYQNVPGEDLYGPGGLREAIDSVRAELETLAVDVAPVRVSGVIGASIFDGFVRLLPEFAEARG